MIVILRLCMTAGVWRAPGAPATSVADNKVWEALVVESSFGSNKWDNGLPVLAMNKHYEVAADVYSKRR